MNSETKNYVTELSKHPFFALRAAPYYAKLLQRKWVERRGRGSRYPFYPDEIREPCAEILSEHVAAGILRDDNLLYLASRSRCFSDNPVTDSILLADGYFDFKNVPDWDAEFLDAEKTVSLHRWNWLLTKFTEDPSHHLGTWGIDLMTDCVSKMGHKKQHMAWETYTVGERICNALLFLSAAGRLHEMPDTLLVALKDMTFYLLSHLEYMPGGMVSNHILNNARALYFAGTFLDVSALSRLAKIILKREGMKIINADGFLREGSSHYQFLATRWFLEIFVLARMMQDDEFCKEIEDVARRMLLACWFFLVFNRGRKEWSIPLIGDVSPDFTPQWLMDVPWSVPARELFQPEPFPVSPQAKGWTAFFPSENKGGAVPAGNGIFAERSFQKFPESGWFRLDFQQATVFWHVEPTGSPLFPSHGHNDTGSFVLFLNGEAVLIDSGRFSYMENKEGLYGMSAAAHNQVTVDGAEPFIYRRRSHYPEFFRKVNVKCEHRMLDSAFEFHLRHEGFKLLFNDKIVFDRTFKVEKNKFIIEDTLQGKHEHHVETYFHFAPRAQLFSDGSRYSFNVRGFLSERPFTFSSSDADDAVIYKGEESARQAGWFFPSYGKKEKCTALVFHKIGKFPVKNTYILSWED